MIDPEQELLIRFPAAIGRGSLYRKHYGFLLERPLEKHEEINEVTRLVMNAADWVGMRLAGYTARNAGNAGNIRPQAAYRLEFAGNEGRAWLEVSRPEMERAAELALEIGELENSIEDYGPDVDDGERLRIAREKLGELMTDFILIWRS